MTDLARYKAALKRGERPSAKLTKTMSEAPIADAEPRTMRFVVSTAAVDRDGDTVAVGGWKTANYEANPVILWGHDQHSLPIGRCIKLENDGTKLTAVVEFVPADMPIVGEMAEAVYRMCRDGYLCATSVGFKPIDADLSTDRELGVDFRTQDLLEISIVSVPSNPEALLTPDTTVETAFRHAPEPTAKAVETPKPDTNARDRRARAVAVISLTK